MEITAAQRLIRGILEYSQWETLRVELQRFVQTIPETERGSRVIHSHYIYYKRVGGYSYKFKKYA